MNGPGHRRRRCCLVHTLTEILPSPGATLRLPGHCFELSAVLTVARDADQLSRVRRSPLEPTGLAGTGQDMIVTGSLRRVVH